MANFSEILNELIRLKGLKNITELSKKLGYKSPEKLSRLTRDVETKPSYDILVDILNTFPDVNFNWLINGYGIPLLDNKNQTIPIKIEETTKAPLITQYAHAGYLNGYSDPEYIDTFHETGQIYIASKKYSGGNYIAFEVRGDSMDDGSKRSICSRDVVLGKELQRHYWSSKLHVPKVFVIVHRIEGITIKEITHHNVESGQIICHPYNPEHEDFELNLKDVVQLFYIKEIKRDI